MRHQRYNGPRRLAALISLLLVVGVVGFAGGAGRTAFAAGTQTITIGTSLSPQAVTVAPGTEVTWQADGGKHRIRSTSGPEKLESDDLEGENSWSVTLTKEGTYSYVDHEDEDNIALHGTVTVSSGAAATPGTAPPAAGKAPGAPAPMSAAVTLSDDNFSPASVTVMVGGTVTWTNGGSEHNVTASAAGAFKSPTLAGGGVFSHTFTAPGTYAYKCTFHGGMTGTVIVPSASGDVPPPAAAAPPAAGAAPPAAGAAPPAAAPGAPAPMSAAVTLSDDNFSPASVTVAVGGTVTWTNGGSEHNVTASAAGAFKSPTLAGGGVFSHTFTAPGTYAYSCTFHGGMNGTVVVPSASGAVPPPAAAAPGAPPAAVAAPPAAVEAAPGKPGKHTVMVSDTGYTPATLNARAGDTVTWVNNGQAPHTATAAGAFDLIMEPGASVSTVLQKPGTIAYVCTYHDYMKASIVVGEALAGVVVAPPNSAAGKATAGKTAAGGAAGGAVGGAAGGTSGAAPASSGKTKTYKVQVKDNTFSPVSVTARVGDTISWTNVGKMPHTMTAGNGSFDKSIAPGETFNVALRAKGTVPYVCTYHPGMDGKLVVGAALAGVAVPPPAANNGGSSGSSGAAAGTAPAAAAPASAGKAKTIEIKVNEMTFAPAMAKANVGDTISWVNVGKIPHTVTAKDGSFDKTPMAPGERFNFVLRKVGSFPYTCTYHPGMDGMLMVGKALAGVAAPAAATASETKADSAAPASAGNATTHEVQVKDSSFTPAMVDARVGDTVSWVNLGKIPHTVTAKDHSFDKTLKPGQRFNLVLTKQGVVEYVCTPHPGMFGTLMVGPARDGANSDGSGPTTLSAMSPVAMAGLGTGWLLIIGLLTAWQLSARIAGRAARQAALRRRASSGDPS